MSANEKKIYTWRQQLSGSSKLSKEPPFGMSWTTLLRNKKSDKDKSGAHNLICILSSMQCDRKIIKFAHLYTPTHGMRRNSLHCKSLVLGYYPILPEMFWSSGFLIFRRKNRWKMIFDGSYGKLFSRSFSFYFSTDFSIHSFLNNSWGNLVYKRNQGVECHGNHRTQLCHMLWVFCLDPYILFWDERRPQFY